MTLVLNDGKFTPALEFKRENCITKPANAYIIAQIAWKLIRRFSFSHDCDLNT